MQQIKQGCNREQGLSSRQPEDCACLLMADEEYLLEELEDEGEEVDYDELILDDDFLGTRPPDLSALGSLVLWKDLG